MSLIDIHIHGNFDEIEKQLKKIFSSITLIHKEMATKEQFQAAFDQMTASIDNIAADIQRLTEQLQTGGLSEADENDILSQLQAKATQLQGIADSTPENPAPPVEPTPEA